MTSRHDHCDFPSIRIENTDYPFSHPVYYDQSLYSQQQWPMYQNPSHNNSGTASQAFHTGSNAFNRGHKRQASDSTIASNGPDSPYTQTTSYPFIVGNDRSPTSAGGYYTEDASSNYSTKPRSQEQYQQFSVGYMPSQLSHTPAAYSTLRDLAMDHHTSTEDVPDFASSRRSVSTHGRNTPTTPRTAPADDSDDRVFKIPSNGEYIASCRTCNHPKTTQLTCSEYPRPRVELFRSESAACQDELYNPENFMASNIQQPPQQQSQVPQNDLLSPHRNLVTERIRTANSVRSQSPAQQSSRERSPFRRGSPLAPIPPDDFRSPGPVLSTAEAVRRQQREQASAQEFARHQPTLKREVTKTISPKDAVLDYNDTEQDSGMSMFHDTIPAGYQRHFGGTETYSNNFVSGTNQAFGQFATPNQQNMAGFRSADGTANFNFMPSPAQMPSSYPTQNFRPVNTGMPEQTPEFPAHLTSMESSISDNPPVSSQESAVSPVMRPANTSANTGTYTCTSPGCAQRFDSSTKLQKHKHEAHSPLHQQQVSRDSSAQLDGSDSPASSPDPTGSGLTSSALLARNSQAGPHKCNRINPSTGKPCATIFSRPYDLTRHEDTIHNRGKQKVRCQYCREEKTFSRNDALTRHMRVVHPEVDFQGKRGRRDF